jgi:hypothetical protein
MGEVSELALSILTNDQQRDKQVRRNSLSQNTVLAKALAVLS